MTPPPSGSPQRFRELDGLRGIAAIGVLLSHYTWAYDSKYIDGQTPWFRFEDGAYGVQLFFLISGFVILMTAARSHRPSDFVISRVTRLYPAYWIALTTTVIVATIFNVPHVPLAMKTVLANISMIQRWFLVPNVDEVYWTLAIEMQFYVLVFAVLVATRTRLTSRILNTVFGSWLVATALVSVWAFPASHGLDPQVVETPVKIVLNAVIAEYAPLFTAGAFLYVSRQRGRLHPMVIVAFAATALNTFLLRDLAHAIVVCVIFVVFAIIAMRDHTRVLTLAPLQWYGRISYSLYITHATVGYATIHLLVSHIGRNAAMLVAFAVATGIAWLVWRIGEASLSPAARRALTRWRNVRLTKARTP